MLTKDHQIPSITPRVKEPGKWSGFLDVSWKLKSIICIKFKEPYIYRKCQIKYFSNESSFSQSKIWKKIKNFLVRFLTTVGPR